MYTKSVDIDVLIVGLKPVLLARGDDEFGTLILQMFDLSSTPDSKGIFHLRQIH